MQFVGTVLTAVLTVSPPVISLRKCQPPRQRGRNWVCADFFLPLGGRWILPQAKDGGREQSARTILDLQFVGTALAAVPTVSPPVISLRKCQPPRQRGQRLSLRRLFPPSGREVNFAAGKRRRERAVRTDYIGFAIRRDSPRGCPYGLSPGHFLTEMPAPSSEGAKIGFAQTFSSRLRG